MNKLLTQTLFKLKAAIGNHVSNNRRLKNDFYFQASARRGRIPQRVWNRHSALIDCWQRQDREQAALDRLSYPENLVHAHLQG